MKLFQQRQPKKKEQKLNSKIRKKKEEKHKKPNWINLNIFISRCILSYASFIAWN